MKNKCGKILKTEKIQKNKIHEIQKKQRPKTIPPE